MKKILSICIVVAALCAVSAQAQFFGGTYGVQTIATVPLTNAGVINTNFALSGIRVVNNRCVAIQLQASTITNAIGPTNAYVSFVRSVDGVNWDSTPFCSLALSLTSNTNAASSTNVFMDAFGWIAPFAYTNGVSCSNVYLRLGLKPGF